MPYRVEIAPAAQRQIRRLARHFRIRIEDAVNSLEENPRPHGSAKLSGYRRVWRIGVGQLRIIYEVFDDESLVVVLRVALRSEGTYREL